MLKHDYADVNGIRLHYVIAGKGDLIMFVHGFPEFWYAWKNQLAEAVLAEGLKHGYFAETDRRDYLEAWSQPGALSGGLNYYRAAPLGWGNLTRGLSSLIVQVPALVIWGEKDPYLLTGNLEGLESYVPRVTIKRIRDGSHWVIHEKPAVVNALIREFLETQRK